MKEIKIVIRVNDKHIATMQNVVGYEKGNLHDQLEILGILDNLLEIQKEKLKTLRKGST